MKNFVRVFLSIIFHFITIQNLQACPESSSGVIQRNYGGYTLQPSTGYDRATCDNQLYHINQDRSKECGCVSKEQSKYIPLNSVSQSAAYLNSQNYNGYNRNALNSNGQNYNAQNYNGQNYNDQNYYGQNYNAQNYNGQNYNLQYHYGQNYNAENYYGHNYNAQNHTAQNYNGQNYNAQNYNGQNYNAQNYNGQNYNNMYPLLMNVPYCSNNQNCLAESTGVLPKVC